MPPVWTERPTHPKTNIHRDDGRVCFYKERLFQPRSCTDKRRIEKLVTLCGDEITPQVVSGSVYYPSSTQEELTCLSCIAKRDAPAPAFPVKPYMPY